MKSVWNPPDFIKFVWNLYEICWISWNPYEIWQISWNPADFRWNPPNWRVFAETSEFIRFWVDFTWNPYEIWWISWNLADFMWNPADFMWNPPKLKSFCWNIWIYKVLGGFHGEIHQISWNLPDFRWNPPDFKLWAFMWWSSIGLSTFERRIRCFSKNSSDWSFEKWKTYTWSSHKSS